jgi:hypothetical protein
MILQYTVVLNKKYCSTVTVYLGKHQVSAFFIFNIVTVCTVINVTYMKKKTTKIIQQEGFESNLIIYFKSTTTLQLKNKERKLNKKKRDQISLK